MCSECGNDMGTAFLITGAVPKHKTADHWPLVRDHRVARGILENVVDLVGPAAVVHALANLGLSQNERRELRNSFAELGRRMGKLG